MAAITNSNTDKYKSASYAYTTPTFSLETFSKFVSIVHHRIKLVERLNVLSEEIDITGREQFAGSDLFIPSWAKVIQGKVFIFPNPDFCNAQAFIDR